MSTPPVTLTSLKNDLSNAKAALVTAMQASPVVAAQTAVSAAQDALRMYLVGTVGLSQEATAVIVATLTANQ